ncbi:MAG TPA: efflux RND transporter periplasmic adaptor subunit [Longimicrobiales bacterium]|nr:efflux RND transporter periplasmic adaptor subunit [Longimicrobiales bacterium]
MIRAMAVALGAALVLGACGGEESHAVAVADTAAEGELLTVHVRALPSTLDAAGVARPYAESTLSTKLMGTVTAVHAREGDRVAAGAVLASIDARDLAAKEQQVAAGMAEAEAMRREALSHAERMRALFAEDAAPKAQLDAAETALARAEAAVRSAGAGAAELGAVRAYSQVRAPFNGIVVRRFVDVGAFAAPGAPLLTVQDASRLRVSVTASPDAARSLNRGDRVGAMIEGVPAEAVVEGVVPAGGNVYTINAIVDNRVGAYMPGTSATLLLPQGTRDGIVIPERAVVRQADLAGVHVRTGSTTELRWIRLGRTTEDGVEVLAGLREGDVIVVPAAVAGAH